MPTDQLILIERLTRIEEKQDSLLERFALSHTRADDHEVRIRTLEKSGARMLGMGAVIAAIAGSIGPNIFSKVVGS